MKAVKKSAPCKVSVITVVLNGEAHIERTIRSVTGQDYFPLEYIIVDGGSTDGTLDLIRKYEERIDRLISEPDHGISDAMNKGIRMATGDIVGIIHSDDFYEPGAVAAVARSFADRPDIDVLHGDMRYFHLEEGRAFVIKPHRDIMAAMWKELPVNHPTVFIKKSVYDKYGLFDTSYRINMDHELILRLLRGGCNFFYLEKVLAGMRSGGVSYRSVKGWAKEYKDAVTRHGYSRTKADLRLLYYAAERAAGNLLRRRGMGFIADIYRRLTRPRITLPR